MQKVCVTVYLNYDRSLNDHETLNCFFHFARKFLALKFFLRKELPQNSLFGN